MPAVLESAPPVLPVRDLQAALAHYRRLGFDVHPYEGGGNGYAAQDAVQLHLSHYAELDPRTTASVVYLYVDDADALHAEWTTAAVPGRLREPRDTEYGIREGIYVDPDGKLIRFGSRISQS
jgi:hypothetical protein